MMLAQVLGRSAVIALLYTALPSVAADSRSSMEQAEQWLKKNCHSLHLFASTPSAPNMNWIAQIPDATCEEAQKITLSAMETERTNYIYERSAKSIQHCTQGKQYSPAECVDQHRRAARNLFIGLELMGNTCARIFRERAGRIAVSGVCVPYTMPTDRDAEWKALLSALYSGTNKWLKSENCTSKRNEKPNALIEATDNLFVTDTTEAAIVFRLESAGFSCKQQRQADGNFKKTCSLDLGGHRFRSAASAPDAVSAVSFGDMLSIKIESDSAGAASDICVEMVSVGL